MEEVNPTSQPQVDSTVVETAPVETTPSISIDSHSVDHPISTYDILGAAITDEEEPDVKYSLSTLWDTTEASAMPRDGGMRPWRDFQNPTRSDTALLGHERNNLRVESPHLVPSSTKSSRAPMHHDPRIAPLTINQQISAAAMREFGLRDDSPTVAHIQPEPPRRPLKSAMKRTPSSDKVVRYDEAATNTISRQHSHTKEKQRFGRFSNFFSRRTSSSEKTAQVSQLNRAASAASGFISTTNIPGLSRQRSIGWNEPIQQYHENRSVSAQSNPKSRSRTANDDILGKAKTNVRRPPKGAKNWFDSYDISSDDDDVTPVELIKDDPVQAANNRQTNRRAPEQTTRQFDPPATVEQSTRQSDRHAAVEQERVQQTQQSRFQHRQQDRIQHIQQQSEDRPSKAERILGQQTNRTADNFHNQLLPVDSHQRVLSPEEEEDYEDEYDQDVTPMANPQNPQREYMQQDDGRVSALSEVSQDQDIDQLADMHNRPSREEPYAYRDATYGYATAVNVQRPRNSRQPIETSHKYQQVERPRLKTNNSTSKVSTRSKQTIDEYEEEDPRRAKHTPKTSRSMSENSRKGRGGYRLSSSHGYDGRGSILMDHVNAELSHMMEVTEEEMALLEMMRNKRAAMQNNNFNEGYRRALQREHEQLMQRRLLAQQTALEILRARDEMEQRQETTTDEEEIEMIVDDKEIRRLTRLRQEEMDRVLRLERFLAMDTSMAAALQESTTGRSKSSKGSKDLSLKSSDRPSTRATRSAEKPTPRTSKSSSSFGRREIHHSKDDSMVSDWRSKSARIDIDPNLFPAPPEQKRSRRPAMEHNGSSVTTNAEEPLVSRQSKAYRKSQVSGTEPTSEEARLREEIRILRAQAAERNNISTNTSPRKSVPSRKQIQATSFLRSFSDYQTPADLTSDNSQETPSVSASVVSPLTPSSLSVLQAEKRSSQGPLDHEDEILSQTSSPEQQIKRVPLDAEALRMMANKQQLQQIQQKKKKQQQFNTLSIIEDSERRILRNSMSSSNSAGEDVLAAWAELGGSMMPSRRR